jgi:hypothetical protein
MEQGKEESSRSVINKQRLLTVVEQELRQYIHMSEQMVSDDNSDNRIAFAKLIQVWLALNTEHGTPNLDCDNCEKLDRARGEMRRHQGLAKLEKTAADNWRAKAARYAREVEDLKQDLQEWYDQKSMENECVRLAIGNLPRRKRPALYVEMTNDERVVTKIIPLAYFVSEDAADLATGIIHSFGDSPRGMVSKVIPPL